MRTYVKTCPLDIRPHSRLSLGEARRAGTLPRDEFAFPHPDVFEWGGDALIFQDNLL